MNITDKQNSSTTFVNTIDIGSNIFWTIQTAESSKGWHFNDDVDLIHFFVDAPYFTVFMDLRIGTASVATDTQKRSIMRNNKGYHSLILSSWDAQIHKHKHIQLMLLFFRFKPKEIDSVFQGERIHFYTKLLNKFIDVYFGIKKKEKKTNLRAISMCDQNDSTRKYARLA